MHFSFCGWDLICYDPKACVIISRASREVICVKSIVGTLFLVMWNSCAYCWVILTLYHRCLMLSFYSRPWLCYWILHSISLLGDYVEHEVEDNVIDFLSRCQVCSFNQSYITLFCFKNYSYCVLFKSLSNIFLAAASIFNITSIKEIGVTFGHKYLLGLF